MFPESASGNDGLADAPPATRHDLRRLAIVLVAAAVLAAGTVTAARLGGSGEALAADPCAPPVTNPIACENTKPGTPRSTWDVTGAGSTSIQGFATDISVNRGETVRFKVNTAARSYRLDIYRMGYYGGARA
jgi:hypothetical protein